MAGFGLGALSGERLLLVRGQPDWRASRLRDELGHGVRSALDVTKVTTRGRGGLIKLRSHFDSSHFRQQKLAGRLSKHFIISNMYIYIYIYIYYCLK